MYVYMYVYIDTYIHMYILSDIKHQPLIGANIYIYIHIQLFWRNIQIFAGNSNLRCLAGCEIWCVAV